mmetsp:Transcript_62750/g.168152  ORF Transcript_62750/g.168152 Transcript_62750/m.168152 type:complete len:94 (-) Transcript_62750:119-400(-)
MGPRPVRIAGPLEGGGSWDPRVIGMDQLKGYNPSRRHDGRNDTFRGIRSIRVGWEHVGGTEAVQRTKKKGEIDDEDDNGGGVRVSRRGTSVRD